MRDSTPTDLSPNDRPGYLFEVEAHERLAAWNAAPMMRWIGVTFLEMADGEALARVALQPHHLGGGGTPSMNGAVIAALFDVVLGAALASLTTRTPQVTLQLGITYEGTLHGDHALCRSRVTRAGKAIAFVQGELVDPQGTVCARSQGTFRRFPPKPTRGA